MQAFTLIEMLVVVSVILILVGIMISVPQGVYQQASLSLAKGELAALAQALEDYKTYYGDYPWINSDIDASQELYAALIGHRRPNTVMTEKGKHFVELSKFTLANEPESNETSNFFKDPWGEPYIYKYKVVNSEQAWEKFGYLLMSKGPDKKEGTLLPEDGILPDNYSDNPQARDNIFAGE